MLLRLRGWCVFAALGIACLAASTSVLGGAELLPPDRPLSEAIDFYVDQRLAEQGVVAAPEAPPASFIRRLTLDLAGRIPTAVEAQSYAESADPHAKADAVARLMASPEYMGHQVNELNALLMAGTRSSARDYLAAALAAGHSWDRIFRDLLLPETTGDQRQRAQSFLRARIKDHDLLTNDVSSVFLGVNISCAQCHDHPLVSDWKQEHFYGLKSFISRSFENGGFIGEREYGSVSYLSPEGTQHPARLMFLSGRVIDEPPADEPDNEAKKQEQELLKQLAADKLPPPAPAFSRRAQLVESALAEDGRHFFARSIVNRLWYRLLGYGLVMPVDQMHAGNPASHPQLLDWLARDLVENGYDLNRTIAGIVLSRAYARSSRWESTERPPPELFAVAQVRPLSPEQLAWSLRLAATDPARFTAELSDAEHHTRRDQASKAARGMVAWFAPVESDFQVGVIEALLFSNDARIRQELLAPGGDRLLNRLLQTEDPQEQVRLAVWNVWSRAPDDDEQRLLASFLSDRSERRQAALEQMLWVLVSSAEMRFNH